LSEANDYMSTWQVGTPGEGLTFKLYVHVATDGLATPRRERRLSLR
jgi:hypothetical protein